MKSVDPSTGKLIKEYYIHTDAEIEEILQQVDEAWQIWKNTSFVKRAVLMKQAARLLRQRKKEYSQLITAEMGKR